MPPRNHAQRAKRSPAEADSASKHRGAAYVAKIVSLRDVSHFVHDHGGGDRAVAWVAARQLGVITSAQLHAAGVGRGAVPSRRDRGLLRPLLRGVYVVGPAPALPGARELAALLVCGPNAVVSHRAAAALWQLAKPDAREIDVTVTNGSHRSRQGLRVHVAPNLSSVDRQLRHGIRLTSPARTLVDFATQATPEELDHAVNEAYALRLVSERQVVAAIERSSGRPGAGVLRARLKRASGPVMTRSEGERRARQLLAAAHLPAPASNVLLAGYEADLVWPEQRLIVEFDGYATHGHRAAFERDRRRDARIVAAGYRVIRITWRQLRDEPFAVVANLAGALAA